MMDLWGVNGGVRSGFSLADRGGKSIALRAHPPRLAADNVACTDYRR